MANDRITLSHGAGGEIMQRLIKERVLAHLGANQKGVEVPLSALDDSAVIDDIAFTIDGHTVKPLFFPGGDIGRLAVAGTVNDIAVIGAQPIALSSSMIIEEGLPFEQFDKIIESMAAACKEAGVPVITGDTKVVEAGAAQQMFITTAGIGKRSKALDDNIKEVKRHRKFGARWLLDSNIKSGDSIIVSGNIGDHGIAVLSAREGYGFETKIKSDVAPINKMLEAALAEGGIVAVKDPTRGGVANTLNEWASKSKVGIEIIEERLPITSEVSSACEMLGIEPLSIGNEGKAVIGVVSELADDIVGALRKTKYGKNAVIIGKATKSIKGVVMETTIGGKRIVEPPIGDPVPRIC